MVSSRNIMAEDCRDHVQLAGKSCRSWENKCIRGNLGGLIKSNQFQTRQSMCQEMKQTVIKIDFGVL